MEHNLDEKLKKLTATIERIKQYELEQKYSTYGERIIECVREGDYEEALFVTQSFEIATTQMPVRLKKAGEAVLSDYIHATIEVVKSLPEK